MAGDENGLYSTANQRLLRFLPVDVENRLRNAVYGGIGAGLSAVWRPTRLVVLGHMRAGSSLASSLLSEHEEIAGYGELFLPYQRPFDLYGMPGKVAIVRKKVVRSERFVLDKVLHNYLIEPDDVDLLRRPDVRVAFLVRSPGPSLASIRASFGHTSSEAADYYVARMDGLRRLSIGLADTQERCAFRYEDLIDRTDEVFAMLEGWLDLRTPLSESYSARARGSDPSANLASGRILRDRKVVEHTAEIEPADLERAEAAHAEAWQEISRSCRTIA